MSRLARLAPMLLALPLATACAVGAEDMGGSSFGPGSVGADDEPEGSSGEPEETQDELPGTTSGGGGDGSTGGGEDDGNPMCCEVGAQAGCGSAVTEACVCTSQPSCCQAVWSQECVDLAIACADPYCEDPGGDSGDSGGSDEGGEIELDCDSGFVFNPPNPAPGAPFTATFTDPVGLTWVGMEADGAGGGTSVDGEWGGVTGTGPFTWSWGYGGLDAGVWTFVFTHRTSENGDDIVHATCDKQF